jgi:mRNA-decapping enzyme subunit 2
VIGAPLAGHWLFVFLVLIQACACLFFFFAGLDDLSVRFIINLPQEDLTSVARICFQVEEAQWFYEDFIRPLDPQLPSMSLREFTYRMFQHCPLLASFSEENRMRAFEEFMKYKTRVPVRGAIMLNAEMDSAVLVKGWKKSSGWGFPKGKINKDEDDLECAIREVDEETGFDIREAGLVPQDEPVKYIDVPMRDQNIRLYVFRGVPMDTKFQPRTRKEISKIQWWKLSDLPAFKKKNAQGPGGQGQVQTAPTSLADKANKFYMVAPFLGHLRKWVSQQKKRDATKAAEAAASGSTSASMAAATAAAVAAAAAAAAAAANVTNNIAHQNEHFATLSLPAAVLEEPMTEDDTWAASKQGGGHAPPQPVTGTEVRASLEDTTRELQRLWNQQSQASAAPSVHSPTPVDTDRQDKGASLLALLQKGPAPATQTTHAPLPHQQPHQHVTMSMQNQPYAYGSTHAPTTRFPATHGPTHAFQPALAHPQPLPPQARSLLVGASGNVAQQVQRRRVSESHHTQTQVSDRQNRVHLVPHPVQDGAENIVTEKKYGNPRQHPQFLQATAMPSPPQALSHLYRDPATGMPFAQGPHMHGSYGMHGSPSQPQQPLPQGSLPNNVDAGNPTVPIDKHRSTLLDMFKKLDSPSPGAQKSPHVAGATPQTVPASSTTGEDIHRGLLSLLPRPEMTPNSRPQTMSPTNPAMNRTPHSYTTNPPYVDPRLASVISGGRPMASPMFSSVYGANPAGNSSVLMSPPAASSFPAPAPNVLQAVPIQHSSAHKQKLLSLFNNANNDPSSGSPAPGPDNSNGTHGEPISSADRNFLLGYLESVTNTAK